MDSVFNKLSSIMEKYNIVHPFNKGNRVAGRDFGSGFLMRRPDLSLISLNRINGLNVDICFDNIEVVININLNLIKILTNEAQQLYINIVQILTLIKQA